MWADIPFCVYLVQIVNNTEINKRGYNVVIVRTLSMEKNRETKCYLSETSRQTLEALNNTAGLSMVQSIITRSCCVEHGRLY